MKFDKDNVKKISYYVACALMVIVIIWLFVGMLSGSDKDKDISDAIARPTPIVTRVVVEKEVEKLVEIEKVISSEIIEEGLRDMGVLITEEYFFTQVEDYSKTKTFFKVITTESGFVYSYDGVIAAGLDFSAIKVTKNDDKKMISVVMPKSSIQYVDIDYESFKKYEEKEGFWNPLTLEDYNISEIEFENSAKARAIDKGILDRADESAKKIIENFVRGLVEDGYEIEVSVR